LPLMAALRRSIHVVAVSGQEKEGNQSCCAP
jgi:hypothetical protein